MGYKRVWRKQVLWKLMKVKITRESTRPSGSCNHSTEYLSIVVVIVDDDDNGIIIINLLTNHYNG